MSLTKEVTFANRKITLEFQKYARQANASVMLTSGETQVLVTVCAADEAKAGQDFLPLTVDYIEKFYAAGKIPGGFVKRETKPSEGEILTSRVIDRPIRPLFSDGYLAETFINCIVVSYDKVNHPAPLAMLGTSMVLMLSDVPFDGPVASVRLGLRDGQYIVDPPESDRSDLDLNFAARPDGILMVEAGANFLAESQMLDAFDYAQELLKPLFAIQYEVQKEIGQPKRKVVPPQINQELLRPIRSENQNDLERALLTKEKQARKQALKEISDRIIEKFGSQEEGSTKTAEAKQVFEYLQKEIVRNLILEKKKRIDGRDLQTIRPISCEVGVLKRAHGSSLFTRGETQSLASVTLGARDDEQRLDSILRPDSSKRFMLNYNFPPFSVGEARPLRPPGRREIGHGNLAERALARVIPHEKEFGYTIRLVSEILESNGSSSMASVCAGSMALLNAGVPIKDSVAGIAMGLIKEEGRFAILSDILGDEDHLGDMDFKVCGSAKGITALQMDIKIGGLSREIMETALAQAKQGREFILGKLNETITKPGEISEYAPRIFQIRIDGDKIRDLIGPGGKMIKKIIAETGAKIDIEQDGLVNIVAVDVASAEAAKKMIRDITSAPELGAIYLGTVNRVTDFGAFIEIKPGVDGLCHISQLDNKRVNRVTDVVKEGDEVLVKIIDIDRQGRIKLSRKEALDKKPSVND